MHIRRIPNHRIEPRRVPLQPAMRIEKDLGELQLPMEEAPLGRDLFALGDQLVPALQGKAAVQQVLVNGCHTSSAIASPK